MRPVKKALKQLGSPELGGQSHEAHLEDTRRCLIKIGDHINDLLATVSKASEVRDWRKYVSHSIIARWKDDGYFQLLYMYVCTYIHIHTYIAVNSASGNARPSTRPVLTGNGNRSPVNSGRQLWLWKPGLNHLCCSCSIAAVSVSPLSSTWPHLNSDVGLEEGEYYQNCLCAIVLCSISAMHIAQS